MRFEIFEPQALDASLWVGTSQCRTSRREQDGPTGEN